MARPWICPCAGVLITCSLPVACSLCTLRGFAFCAAGELIQSPIRSRRGFPADSSNRSRIRDSRLRSPTNRSVAGSEHEAELSDVVCARYMCADVGSCSGLDLSMRMALPGSWLHWGGDHRFRSLGGSHLGNKCRHCFCCEIRWRIASIFPSCTHL